MRTETPNAIFLKDYLPPAYFVDTVDLVVQIQPGYADVAATLALKRNPAQTQTALRLDGEGLNLLALELDGRQLQDEDYALGEGGLTIFEVPERAILRTRVRIDPDRNTSLSGLYRSKDGYFTQCEAQGFRGITFYPDRPDVMAKFTCRIEADKASFPQLLSNGNPIAAGDLADGRHFATWEDPFRKPSYLFALVAAKLDVLEDNFVTRSGRKVRCAVYVEPGKLDQCGHAMAALKKAMRWDEEVFGLEMDLGHYMIVAVGDFNMGAMENKGLNIFNTKYVMARPDTATDTDYQNIDRVVAHEYFHNWTGNRVTCRDWFQLSLKEGLTVFRDQQFGMDMHSAAVTRIQEVRTLRAAQFPEDAGPMAHPIRPASYAEINNFYTATVYEKGAEVIRMIHTLLGKEKFRAGMDLYFQRHDGQAVTCEDFVAAMQDASGVDLTQFRRWYARAGTPRLVAQGVYDAVARRYTLTLAQQLAPTAYEGRLQAAGIAVGEGLLHIPVALGLVLPDGSDCSLRLAGEAAAGGSSRVLSLRAERQSFVFEDVPAPPVPSLLRGFSAPVKLEFACSDADLAHLMAHDSDPFNRWEAGQQLAMRVLLAGVEAFGAGRGEALAWVPAQYVEAMRRLLADRKADPALLAEALVLPGEGVIAEAIAGEVDPDAVHAARLALRRQLAGACRAELLALHARLVLQIADATAAAGYSPEATQSGLRALRNACLGYLAELDDGPLQALVVRQFETADNMTDKIAALSTLANLDVPPRKPALAAFYEQWKDEALVVDKWLQVQAASRLPGTVERVRELLAHPAFDLRNPNKVYALVRSFVGANPKHFHAADGSGYRLAADIVIKLDEINPQVAARIARAFDRWRRCEARRQKLARLELERIAAKPGLSKDVAEIVGNALAG
jgi:aminopeptidase N